MGVPAVRMDGRYAVSRPRLRLVRQRTAPGARRVTPARVEQRCRELFSIACVVMIALALFALGRVMLSARATEVAFQSNALMNDIKDARLTGDLLEVDKSALSTPSRIEFIAGQTLDMGEACEVTYLRIPGSEAAASCEPAPDTGGSDATVAQAAEDGAGAPEGVAGMLASVMEMAAGEAQLLLVGDAGLARAR